MVRGNQPDLRILEEEWHKIVIQIGWKLEPVFQLDNSAVDEAPIKVKPGSPTMTLPQQLPNVFPTSALALRDVMHLSCSPSESEY